MTISEEYIIGIDYSKTAKKIRYKIDNNGCWNCISHSKDKDGYIILTRIYKDKKYHRMHRFLYAYFIGELTDTDVVRHYCDNFSCINPNHLFKGFIGDSVINEIGKRYNMLVIIRKNEEISKTRKRVYFDCACDCGKITTVSALNLRRGHTKSCGCLQRERASESSITHNKSNTRIYKIYAGAKHRCYGINNPKYNNYGARGIKVCDEWLGKYGFQNFYKWATENGYKDNLTLDRINVDGNYCPDNCRWVRHDEQARNKQNSIKVFYNGKEIFLLTLLRKLDREQDYEMIKRYLKRDNMTIEEALSLNGDKMARKRLLFMKSVNNLIDNTYIIKETNIEELSRLTGYSTYQIGNFLKETDVTDFLKENEIIITD